MTNPLALLVGAVTGWFGRLRFPVLLILVGLFFVVDLVIPDPLPFADELLVGLVTALLASWKKKRLPEDADGNGGADA